MSTRRRRATHQPLELTFLFDLYATAQLAITLSDEAVAPYGVADGFAALSVIRAEGPLTPTDLAHRLGVSPTTMSGLVRRLRRRGLVLQLPNPHDGRSYLLALSAGGKRALTRAGPAFRALLRRVEGNLDVPVDDVREALASLEAALRRTNEQHERSA